MKGSNKRLAIRPRLHDCGGDPSKRWFVYYSYRNPDTGKMVRFKRHEGFDQLKTAKEKLKHGEDLIQQINKRLDAGWSPFSDSERFVYKSIVEHRQTEKEGSKISMEYCCNCALEKRKKQIRQTSFQSYQSQIRVLLQWVKKNGIRDLFEFSENVERFFDHLKGTRNNTTHNNYLTNLKGLFNTLTKDGIVPINPFLNIESLKENKESKKAFSVEQIQLIKQSIANDPVLWNFVQFMYYTFIRPRELRFLKVMDIELNEGKIRVRGEVSKNGKTQYVLIPEAFKKHLEKLNLHQFPSHYFVFGKHNSPGEIPCSKNHFYNRHQVVLRDLKFSDAYSLYSWKHTGVKEAAKKGLNLKEIQMQLRHHSLDQTDAYLKSLGILELDGIKNNFPEI